MTGFLVNIRAIDGDLGDGLRHCFDHRNMFSMGGPQIIAMRRLLRGSARDGRPSEVCRVALEPFSRAEVMSEMSQNSTRKVRDELYISCMSKGV